MTLNIGGRLDSMMDHYVLVCLFLTQFILTLTGVGNILITAVLGLILCAAGAVQRPAQADLWVLLPLVVYNLFSMASSWRTYNSPALGYAPLQWLLPVVYLLMACLEEGERRTLRRLCILWAGVVAAEGIVQFLWRAMTRGAQRLGGFLGNPNAMGIFLVISWFLLLRCLEEGDAPHSRLLERLEPVILTALALTLSMGSFVAMAAGILVLLAQRGSASWTDTFFRACRVLARASLGVGTGILIYLAASRTGRPWTALLPAGYVLALAACWPGLEGFLERRRPLSAAIAGTGALVALAAVAVRPSAIATFAERLEMMANGLGYLGREPLLGVGPYQWRLLNLYDGDKYFNTNHIHNAFIHVGVELGLTAMVMLAVVAVRAFRKGGSAPRLAGCAAFLTHCMMDTGFFYMGLTGMALTAAAEPERGGRLLPAWVQRAFFMLLAGLFAYYLYFCIRYGS